MFGFPAGRLLFCFGRGGLFIVVRIQNQVVDPHELLCFFCHLCQGFFADLCRAAIQAEGFANATEAFAAFDAQA